MIINKVLFTAEPFVVYIHVVVSIFATNTCFHAKIITARIILKKLPVFTVLMSVFAAI